MVSPLRCASVIFPLYLIRMARMPVTRCLRAAPIDDFLLKVIFSKPASLSRKATAWLPKPPLVSTTKGMRCRCAQFRFKSFAHTWNLCSSRAAAPLPHVSALPALMEVGHPGSTVEKSMMKA